MQKVGLAFSIRGAIIYGLLATIYEDLLPPLSKASQLECQIENGSKNYDPLKTPFNKRLCTSHWWGFLDTPSASSSSSSPEGSVPRVKGKGIRLMRAYILQSRV